MFPPDEAWNPQLRWDSPAGRVLQQLLSALPCDSPIRITVFGSAPLQLGIDAGFLSADVDVFSVLDLSTIVRECGLGAGQNDIYIQQNDAIVFRASSSWPERAFEFHQNNVTLVFPHPIDILVAKLPRLEPKDLSAFRLVKTKTGHPTAEELKAALMENVDMFRPAFDEENSGDPIANTRRLWQELFGLSIDVRLEIIKPALERRKRAYENDVADDKQTLRKIGAGEI